MGFYKEKVSLSYEALTNENIDMWVVVGDESATNSEPVLECFGDFEFIGMTALIFNKNHTCAAITTPLDKNGYIHHGVFDEVIDFKVSFIETFKEYLLRYKPKVLALDYSKNDPSSDGLTYGTYKIIKEAIDSTKLDIQIVSAENIIRLIRGVKCDEEITKIKEACIKTQEIFDDAKKIIKAGMSEKEVYDWFQNETVKRGYEFSWPKGANPGVSVGPNSPTGHSLPSDIVIEKGHLVNVDFGIRVNGYSSDIQRMYYILKDDETDAPDDIKKAFNTVSQAIKLAAKALKPNSLGVDIDKVARDYVVSSGYESWNWALGHSLGHFAHDGGLLLARDNPSLKRDNLIKTPIPKGYVFTLEPGVKTRCGGLSLEEDVVVKSDGAEFLIEPQDELYLI